MAGPILFDGAGQMGRIGRRSQEVHRLHQAVEGVQMAHHAIVTTDPDLVSALGEIQLDLERKILGKRVVERFRPFHTGLLSRKTMGCGGV